MITEYPKWTELSLEMRDLLYPAFHALTGGISEFTFANLYLFRKTYNYKISKTADGLYLFRGTAKGENFFLLPFGFPPEAILKDLFSGFTYLKCASKSQANLLAEAGYIIEADRNNFDYLYLRSDLAALNGKKFHKKRNHVNAFIQSYNYSGARIEKHNLADAMLVLENWRRQQDDNADYLAAEEALLRKEELMLCGSLIYVEKTPVAFTLGEELAAGTSFAIHFEKAVGEYRGVYQFINKCFATLLPEKYKVINREQDLGDAGLRQAKLSYQPYGFVEKYRVYAAR